MKNLLLYGVGTFKNRGVEAIINSTLKELFNLFAAIKVYYVELKNNYYRIDKK